MIAITTTLGVVPASKRVTMVTMTLRIPPPRSQVPSGKHTKNYGKSSFYYGTTMGKSWENGDLYGIYTLW